MGEDRREVRYMRLVFKRFRFEYDGLSQAAFALRLARFFRAPVDEIFYIAE
jgi:hypothetical protein